MLDFGLVPDNFTYIGLIEGLCKAGYVDKRSLFPGNGRPGRSEPSRHRPCGSDQGSGIQRNALTRHVEVEPETFCKCWMRSSPARRVSLQAEVHFISLSKEICLSTTCV